MTEEKQYIIVTKTKKKCINIFCMNAKICRLQSKVIIKIFNVSVEPVRKIRHIFN